MMSHRTRSGRKFGVQQRSKKANEKINEDEDGGVHRNELMKLTKAQLVQKLLDLNARESNTVSSSSSSSSSATAAASSSSSAAATAAASSSSSTSTLLLLLSSSSSSSSSRSFQDRPRSSIHGPSSRRSIDLTGYVSLLEGLLCKDVSQRIVSFLPASSMLRLRCISTGLKKSVEKFEIADFTLTHLRDPAKILPHWQYFCTKSTSLVELKIELSPFESCVVESLLTRCDCSSLRSVALWYRGTVFGPYIFHHGIDHLFKLKWENDTLCPDGFVPNKLLIHVDPTFRPVAQEDHRDVLAILSSKCAASLTKLRVPLSNNRRLIGTDGVSGDGRSSLSAISLHAFRNLVDLEVSMGEPSSVLTAVESLCMLRRFTWLSNRIGLEYDKHNSPSYVLRSRSLQKVDMAPGKDFFLADIKCSSLQALTLGGTGIYSGGILSGEDVIGNESYRDPGRQVGNLTVYCVSDSVRYSGKEMVKATAFYGVFYEKEWSEVSYVDERGEFGVADEMTNWRFAIVFKELSLPSECNVTFG